MIIDEIYKKFPILKGKTKQEAEKMYQILSRMPLTMKEDKELYLAYEILSRELKD
jgi:hypothetical protein